MERELGFEFVLCLVEIILLERQEAERGMGAADGWV